MTQSGNVAMVYFSDYRTMYFISVLLTMTALCSCVGQEKLPDPVLEQERNVPVQLSVKLVDQFGNSASGASCYVQSIPSKWWHVSGDKYEDSYSEKDMHEERISSSPDGTIFYKDEAHRAPSVVFGIDDKNYMQTQVQFALLPYFLEKFMDPKRDIVHKFDKENPVVIHVWRRTGFKPLVRYEDRNNELDLISAEGEIRFDLATFQPVEKDGDIIVKWNIGDAIQPDLISFVKRPEKWLRTLQFTVTVVDGFMWSITDERQWQSAHGVVPGQMPPGQSVFDEKRILNVGEPQLLRFLLVSKNDKLCAKVSLRLSLRDTVKGLVRLNFANTVVNPAGPPSLEIQPSEERDLVAGDARQQWTAINTKLRSIGSGPPPSLGPTAEAAWAVYDKECDKRGIKPIPRPASK